MNKRERYTKDNMPESVAIIYERFFDREFVAKVVQWMVADEEDETIHFDVHRFRMFKVEFTVNDFILWDLFSFYLIRVYFETMV